MSVIELSQATKAILCCSQDTLQRHTVATGYAGISTDAALPLSRLRLCCLIVSFKFSCFSTWMEFGFRIVSYALLGEVQNIYAVYPFPPKKLVAFKTRSRPLRRPHSTVRISHRNCPLNPRGKSSASLRKRLHSKIPTALFLGERSETLAFKVKNHIEQVSALLGVDNVETLSQTRVERCTTFFRYTL